jgi:hypothetical protein
MLKIEAELLSAVGFSPNLLTAGVLVNSLMPLNKQDIFLCDFGKVVVVTWGSDRDQDRTVRSLASLPPVPKSYPKAWRLGDARLWLYSPLGKRYSAETLRLWARRSERDRGARHGLTTDERDRLKALERENRELRQANEILRKASAQAEFDRRFRP